MGDTISPEVLKAIALQGGIVIAVAWLIAVFVLPKILEYQERRDKDRLRVFAEQMREERRDNQENLAIFHAKTDQRVVIFSESFAEVNQKLDEVVEAIKHVPQCRYDPPKLGVQT